MRKFYLRINIEQQQRSEDQAGVCIGHLAKQAAQVANRSGQGTLT